MLATVKCVCKKIKPFSKTIYPMWGSGEIEAYPRRHRSIGRNSIEGHKKTDRYFIKETARAYTQITYIMGNLETIHLNYIFLPMM